MNDSSKVLKIVFVILLLVTAAEIGYFFFNKTNANVLNKIFVKPSPTIVTSSKTAYERWVSDIPNRGGIDKSYIGFLAYKKPTVGENNYWLLKQTGQIKDVELNGKDPKGRPFGLRFTLINDKGDKFDTYYFNKNDSKLEIYQIINGVKTELDGFDDFTEGSTVTYLETDDLSKKIGSIESVNKVELDLYK